MTVSLNSSHGKGDDLDTGICHFPVGSDKVDGRTTAANTFVFGEKQVSIEGLENTENRLETVQIAWGLLLRNYLNNDTIAFAAFSDPGCEVTPEKSNGCNSTRTQDDVEVLRYEFVGNQVSQNVRAVVSAQHLVDSRLNTAVYYPAQDNGKKADRVLDAMASIMSKFSLDLAVNINTSSPHLDLKIIYRTTTVSVKYAIAICQSFQVIYQNISKKNVSNTGPPMKISEHDGNLLREWSPKNLLAQRDCLHDLVQRSVDTSPTAEAVCSWDGSLTYAELDIQAMKLADHLIRVGVGPGVYVPFALEKTLWTVVALLAILRAGGAFVPLDPAHPKARLQEILNAINAKVVITSELYRPLFSGLVEQVVIASEINAPLMESNGFHNGCTPKPTPEDPVLILFTSGSTGNPKGIVLEHAAISNHTIAHGKAMNYHRARVLQFAAHTFDVAVMDIFTTLVFGGCVCIPSEEERKNDLVGVINRMKVDLAILMPQVVRLLDPAEVPTLRILATGGEPLPRACRDSWASKASFIQIYGPAEVGICLLTYMESHTAPETVGYPLENNGCWLVDPEDPHSLVPIGAVGELVVAGSSLARAYLNDTEKTRASFLENLEWAKTVVPQFTRFYRTGDLLQYNTASMDGSFNFVGRKDSQIKLRSQRLEPSEVEHHLTMIPGVSIAVVVFPRQGCYVGELVAVIKVKQTSRAATDVNGGQVNGHSHCGGLKALSRENLSAEFINHHLSKVLPGYMIPTIHLEVTDMPFTPSMKLDRKRVRQWLEEMPARCAGGNFIAKPDINALDANDSISHELSRKIADIVASSDDTRRQMLVGKNFNIQSTGINSIQIMSLSLFLRRRFHLKVPMDILLSHKVTVQDLANIVGRTKEIEHVLDAQALDLVAQSEILAQDVFQGVNPPPDCIPLKHPAPVRNVLLTGATGYLGTAILQTLLESTETMVFVLVRSSSAASGLQRIVDAATRAKWWQDKYCERVQVWPGNLEADDLGLDENHLTQLGRLPSNTSNGHANGTVNSGSNDGQLIDAVIHNGAVVHYGASYEKLFAANVRSTTQLLKLTADAPQISTFVFVSGGRKPTATPEDNTLVARAKTAAQLKSAGGYAQTKFVAEQVVHRCGQHAAFRGKRVHTVRPGYIIGPASTGHANTSDFIWRLVAGCVEVGAYNCEEGGRWLFMGDTTQVASCVVRGISHQGNKEALGEVQAVLSGLFFADLWDLLREEFGYALEGLPRAEWTERLRDAVAEKEEGHLLFPLLDVLERDGGILGEVVLEARESDARVVGAVRENVKYLISVGMLPVPKSLS